MQKTIFLALFWQTPFLVISYRNQPWHVGKKEFCYERYWRDQRISGGTGKPGSETAREGAMLANLQVTLCGCRHAWGLGSCHVPPPTLDVGRYHLNCCLCSHLSTESTLGSSYFSMTFASNLERVEMDTSDGQCPGHVPTCGHKSIWHFLFLSCEMGSF